MFSSTGGGMYSNTGASGSQTRAANTTTKSPLELMRQQFAVGWNPIIHNQIKSLVENYNTDEQQRFMNEVNSLFHRMNQTWIKPPERFQLLLQDGHEMRKKIEEYERQGNGFDPRNPFEHPSDREAFAREAFAREAFAREASARNPYLPRRRDGPVNDGNKRHQHHHKRHDSSYLPETPSYDLPETPSYDLPTRSKSHNQHHHRPKQIPQGSGRHNEVPNFSRSAPQNGVHAQPPTVIPRPMTVHDSTVTSDWDEDERKTAERIAQYSRDVREITRQLRDGQN